MSSSSCPRCGAVSRNHAAFCSQCGASLAIGFPDTKAATPPPPPIKKAGGCYSSSGRGGRMAVIFVLMAAGMAFAFMRAQARHCRRVTAQPMPTISPPDMPGSGWRPSFSIDSVPCPQPGHEDRATKTNAATKRTPPQRPDRGLKSSVRQEAGDTNFVHPGEPIP